MRGAARRDQIALEISVAQAWHTENFRRAGKKLKDLDHYLKKLRPKTLRPAQTAEEVLAIFKALAARGAGITIRKRDE